MQAVSSMCATTGTELPVLMPELHYYPWEASLLQKRWMCSRITLFCLWGAPNVTSSNGKSSLCASMPWYHTVLREKSKTKEEASLNLSFLSLTGTIATVCRKETKNVSDGDETARGDASKTPLHRKQVCFLCQAVLFYSKHSTWCKPGVQTALPWCSQRAVLQIWQAAVLVPFSQAASSRLF